jgi:hypothetical protein
MPFVARQQILNKQEWTAATKERLAKHVPAETISTREWTMLPARSVPRSYKEDNWE